jgi:hypothetical protein
VPSYPHAQLLQKLRRLHAGGPEAPLDKHADDSIETIETLNVLKVLAECFACHGGLTPHMQSKRNDSL